MNSRSKNGNEPFSITAGPIFVDQNDLLDLDHDLRCSSADSRGSEVTEAQISVTDAQADIINYPHHMNQILSIRAGPGSGKTFTLIARIAKLVQDGIRPDEILVLSMANRSVDALRNSLRCLVGKEKEELVAFSTFHSFCGSLLDSTRRPEESRPRIATRQIFLKFAEFFQKSLVELGGVCIGGYISARRMAETLPLIVSGRVTVEEIAEKYNLNAEYLRNVVTYLKSYGIAVYDDIIGDAVNQLNASAAAYRDASDLETAESCLHPEVANYKVVIVDEFQDIYPILLDAIKAIVNYPTFSKLGESKHLTISGDPLQSIYGFLGSSATHMSKIEAEFPRMVVSEKGLDESFRCTQDILDATVGVIKVQNGSEGKNTIRSLRPIAHGTKPVLYSSENPEQELNYVADEIARLLCLLGGFIQPRDIAVLGCTNKQVMNFQQVFRERVQLSSHRVKSLSYWPKTELNVFRMVAGVISGKSHASFDLLGILQILDHRTGSTQRVAKLFMEGLESDLFSGADFFEKYLRSELERLKNGDTETTLSKIYRGRAEQLEIFSKFFSYVQYERNLVHEKRLIDPSSYGPKELAECFRRMSEIKPVSQYLQTFASKNLATVDEGFQSLNSTIHYVYGMFERLEEQRSVTFLDFFLENYESEGPVVADNSVQVSTIHSAKGLEFPIVFILGMQHRGTYVTPTWNSCLRDESQSEDEFPTEFGNETKRLLYVGMTRARSLLYVGIRGDFNSFLEATKTYFTSTLPYPLSPDLLEDDSRKKVLQYLSQVQNDERFASDERLVHLKSMATFGQRSSKDLSFMRDDLQRPPPTALKILHGVKTYSKYCLFYSLNPSRNFSTRVRPSQSYPKYLVTYKTLHCVLCRLGKVVNAFVCR